MLRFFALIPTLQILDVKRFFNEFVSEYEQYYLLDKEEVNANSIVFRLSLKEKQIDEWKERVKNNVGTIHGIDVIVKALRQVHNAKITSTGIVQIDFDNIDPENIEYIKDELTWHCYKFLDRSIEVLNGLGYSVPSQVSEEEQGFVDVQYSEDRQDSEILTNHLSAMVLPISYGINAEIDSLGNAINKRLIKFLSLGSELLNSKAKKIFSLMKWFKAPFLLRRGYVGLAKMLSISLDITTIIRILKATINRNVNRIKDDYRAVWENAYHNAMAISEFFDSLTEEISLILRIYSDHVGIVGIFATFMGLGIGTLILGYTLPNDNQLKDMTIWLGKICILVVTLIWFSTRATSLISKQLGKLNKTLKIGIMSPIEAIRTKT